MLQSPIHEAFAEIENLSSKSLSGKPLDSLHSLEIVFARSHSFTGCLRAFLEQLLALPFWQSQGYPSNPFAMLCLDFAAHIDFYYSASVRREPAYHSRKHFQDVCLALTALLSQSISTKQLATQQNPWIINTQEAWVLLFCALAHDFGHDGSINHSPFELENRSIENARSFLQQSAGDPSLITSLSKQIEPIIRATDPAYLELLLEQCQDLATTPTKISCLSMLLVEADLLASALPISGKMLGKLLEEEWMPNNPNGAAMVSSNQGRQQFLQRIRFVSPQANLLGMEAIRTQSIKQTQD